MMPSKVYIIRNYINRAIPADSRNALQIDALVKNPPRTINSSG